MAIRAKFRCNSYKQLLNEDREVSSIEVTLNPVYSGDPDSENRKFWDATPSGSLSMQINNPQSFEFFRPGQYYYIDVSEAPDS